MSCCTVARFLPWKHNLGCYTQQVAPRVNFDAHRLATNRLGFSGAPFISASVAPWFAVNSFHFPSLPGIFLTERLFVGLLPDVFGDLQA